MKNTIAKYAFASMMLLSVLVACKKDYALIETEDAEAVAKYIQSNSLKGMTEYVIKYENNKDVKTGVYYQILEHPTGEEVADTSKIYMNYTVKPFNGGGDYTDENIYRYADYLGYLSVKKYPLPTTFHSIIKDVLKKKGGKIRFLIPSHLAYGNGGTSNPFKIDGNQSLDCTITLYNVKTQRDFEDIFVQKYIQSKNITGLTKTSTGLHYQIIEPGTGTEEVNQGSIASFVYSLKLTNGEILDSNTASSPLKSALDEGSGLRRGVIEGLLLIKKGGKIRLIIPPSLAYGISGSGSVPPNSILDFDIELIEVEN